MPDIHQEGGQVQRVSDAEDVEGVVGGGGDFFLKDFNILASLLPSTSHNPH